MIYRGQSMNGTFCFGDCLTLEAVALADVRTGDVLVYCRTKSRGEEDWVAHRAVRITADGVIVQGDKNLGPDPTPVTQDNFAGRVSHIIRGGKTIKVRGGIIGHSRALLVRSRVAASRWLGRRMRQLGRGSYAWLRQSNLVTKIWRPEIKKMQVMTEKGPVIKYVVNNRTVAECWQENNRFTCQKPYDLVLWPVLKKDRCVPD